ncbi:MAG: IS110 family transposase [Coriobacteriia bacterium]|jgi:transposase|nr:IS110 family transposase [Coriobacteriia bacterium]
MSKKRTYSSVDVERFDFETMLPRLGAACIVSVDVAKTDFYAGIATQSGDVLKIVRFKHPTQTRAFLSMIEALRHKGTSPQIVMEPTGTYGDAFRHQCHVRALPVFMSSPKHTHDMAEVLDGVPSMHDAKAVVVLAKLHAIRPGKRWEPESEARRTVRTTFDRREVYADALERNYGRLEALLARFWPGLDEFIKVQQQRSWMSLLEQFPGPEAVAAHAEQARVLLKKASRGALGQDKIDGIVASACACLGVPMTDGDRTQFRELVQEIRRLTAEQDRLDAEIAKAVRAEPAAKRIVSVIGPAASAVILAYLGDPAQYASAGALEKAAGLNLKVRSSGKTAGQLKLTKRGPAVVRKYLYLAALRLILNNAVVRAWYVRREGYQSKSKLKAVVAVVRKLIRALWHVARHDESFDATRLFDTRSLNLEVECTQPSSPRFTAKSSCAGGRKPPATRSHVAV